METTLNEEQIRRIMKDVIFELLTTKRDLFKEILEEILEEVIEDIALGRAIEEGRKDDFVSKGEILETIEF